MINALLIDVSNLNVFFCISGRLCMGVNYTSCPERIAYDSQALGASFDVYLTMWPRQKGEGDAVIPSLNSGDLQFWCLKEEVRELFNFFEKIPGVNTIYLCNALSNFIKTSRVENFSTVLCCGNRYALVDVKQRLPVSLEVFEGQKEFFDEKGSEFTCYGDLDLVDVDNIRSLYPELSKFKRSTLVPLTQLIMSYRYGDKVTSEEAKKEMARYVPEGTKSKVVKQEVVEEPVEEVVEEPKKQKVRHGKVDWLSLGMASVICLCSMCLGFAYQFRNIDQTIESYTTGIPAFETDTEYQLSIRNIYDTSTGIADVFAEIITYAKASELDAAITSLNGFTDRVILQCNCRSADVKDQLVQYLERRYTVSAVNQYGTINNTDGTVTYQYGITLIF